MVKSSWRVVQINGTGELATVVRYKANGKPDSSFSGDGILTFSFGNGYGSIDEVVLQPDGKIIVGGTWRTSQQNGDFALARLNNNGSFDNSFDNDGKLLVNISPSTTSNDNFGCLALQPDGKILVGGGIIGFAAPGNMVLARYLSNGNPDNSFDGDGILIVDIDGGEEFASSMARLADGKIIAAGYGFYPNGHDMVLFRCDSVGKPDNSFDGDGKVREAFGPHQGMIRDLALQSDGKMVVAVRVIKNNNDPDIGIARFLQNGKLDKSFNGNGTIFFDFNSQNGEDARAISVQSDGKILVLGEAQFQPPQWSLIDIALVRVDRFGQPDTGFDGDGKKLVDLGSSEICHEMQLVGDRIYTAGTTLHGLNHQFFLVVLKNDGSPQVGDPPSTTMEPSIRLYPNPVQGILYLETNGIETGTMRIYNSAGALVAEKPVDSGGLTEISVIMFAGGLYFLEMNTGSRQFVKKFIR